jgi:hypothetical protein
MAEHDLSGLRSAVLDRGVVETVGASHPKAETNEFSGGHVEFDRPMVDAPTLAASGTSGTR